MTTTPLPPPSYPEHAKHGVSKDGKNIKIVFRPPLYTADQMQAYATQARAALEAENANLKRDAEMHEAVRAGDSVLLNEQAALLRECRAALDALLAKKPMLAATVCGSTSLGNLRVSLYEYRPAGVFGGAALKETP